MEGSTAVPATSATSAEPEPTESGGANETSYALSQAQVPSSAVPEPAALVATKESDTAAGSMGPSPSPAPAAGSDLVAATDAASGSTDTAPSPAPAAGSAV